MPRRAAGCLLVSILGMACLVPGPGRAHHSVAAFDTSRTAELTGTLALAQLANPHSRFHVTTRDAQGRVVTWIIEAAGAATVLREARGGPSNRFATGQAITVTFHPARDGRPLGNLVALRFTDGQVVEGIRIP